MNRTAAHRKPCGLDLKQMAFIKKTEVDRCKKFQLSDQYDPGSNGLSGVHALPIAVATK